MEFNDVLAKRRSTRVFTDRPILEKDLRELVWAASQAPSWTNSQPWRVQIATGATLAQIKQAHLNSYRNGIHGKLDYPYATRGSWDQLSKQNSAQWGQALMTFLGDDAQQMSEANVALFNAQAIVYLTLPKTASLWSVYDLGAFGQTLMLAATNKQIDSIVAYELVKYADDLKEILDIPNDMTLAMGIALGYRDKNYRINDFQATRTKLDNFLTIKH